MTLSTSQIGTYADHSQTPPQLDDAGARTWITRGANFVVAVSDVTAGAELTRVGQLDEYFVILPQGGAEVVAGGERVNTDAGVEAALIVPPGDSVVRATQDGRIVRVFSNRAADLLALAVNAATYADGAPQVAPLVDWPEPTDGYRLRHYVLADYTRADSNMRIFRSRNLMVNFLGKRTVPRDTAKLSPHQHADFEQGSLVVEGRYVHHLRYPWTPDMSDWRADEHVEIGVPSLTVIPPKVIHTSRNVSEGDCWLIDIFAPPREDFSRRDGLVCNADVYPMPVADGAA